ncbi:MAG: bifunctional adenosylcobinamide kinase/adenosylcobinamide-phosphate guanylyltransferase [Spirochaetes bacterium RBG_16_49_21]|nr:MAG: bifunctional adenosylcobinamide kinase/adenosylcobinamide-phosphate guanylyltransferase [Spirochaetes bacterium RBG_16_49_21]
MGKIIFITGGARSGKSRFAESLLAGKDDVLYVATAIGFDDEMKERIARHRARRNSRWETVECYSGFSRVLPSKLAGRGYILLDCVTIMVSNVMILDSGIDWDKAGPSEADAAEKKIMEEASGFLAIAREFAGEAIIVSNELGMGLVPPNPLGRYYRDIAGTVNMKIAAEADEVYFMVSGIPVRIK